MAQLKTCKRCGKEFLPRGTQLYCGNECRAEAERENQLRYYYERNREPAAADGKNWHNKTCKYCHEPFVGGSRATVCPACRGMRNVNAPKAPKRVPAPPVKKALSLTDVGKLMRLSGMLYPDLQRMETYEPEGFAALRERYGV